MTAIVKGKWKDEGRLKKSMPQENQVMSCTAMVLNL